MLKGLVKRRSEKKLNTKLKDKKKKSPKDKFQTWNAKTRESFEREKLNGSDEEEEEARFSLAVALYNYVPEQTDEIPLQKGEQVIVYDQDESGWWTGESKGNYGLFPGGFVKLLPLPPASTEETTHSVVKESASSTQRKKKSRIITPRGTSKSKQEDGSKSERKKRGHHRKGSETALWRQKYDELLYKYENLLKERERTHELTNGAIDTVQQQHGGSDREDLEADQREIQKQNQKLIAQNQQLQEEVASVRKQYEELKHNAEQRSVESELEHWLDSDKAKTLAQERDELQQELLNVKSQLETYTVQCKTLEAEKRAAETVMRELEEERDVLLKKHQEKSETVEEVTVRELLGQKKRQEIELAELKSKVEMFETKKKMESLALPDDSTRAKQDLISELVELRRKVQVVTDENSKLRAELSHFEHVVELPKQSSKPKNKLLKVAKKESELSPAQLRARRLSNLFLSNEGKRLKYTGIVLEQ